MLLIEGLSASGRRVVALLQQTERLRCEHLAAAEEILAAVLGDLAIDPGSLILEVQDEPQLETRVGDRKLDVVVATQGDRLSDVRMLVDVEHAPDLVERPTATSAGVPLVALPPLDRSFYELKRAAAERIDRDKYSFAELPMPVGDVELFRSQALNEGENLATRRLAWTASPRWTTTRSRCHPRLPALISSAAAVNSCSERMGVAP